MDPHLSPYDEQFSREVARHVTDRVKRLFGLGLIVGALVAYASTALALTLFPNAFVYVAVTAVAVLGLAVALLLTPSSLPRAWRGGA